MTRWSGFLGVHYTLKDLKYTILDTQNVYRGAEELAELHSINEKKLPKEYVALRPERMALHETIISVVTSLKLKDEGEMQEIVRNLFEEVKTKLPSLHLDELRSDIESEITRKAEEHLSGKPVQDEQLKSIFDEVISRKEHFGKYVEGYTVKDAMKARATDVIFAEQAKKRISEVVSQTIAKQEQSKFLQVPEPDKRLLLMVCGGQASGKGSSVAMLQKSAAEEGVDWTNVVKVNTDSFKSLLLPPGSVKPELYSQLSQDEASSINQEIQKCLKEQAKKGKAPHIFIDQVFVGPDQIDLGLTNQGKVRGIIVSTDVSIAVERSFKRGFDEGDKGRYENTGGILRCHKMMTEQVPTTLARYAGQNVEFLLVDNNVEKGEQAKDVLLLDMKNNNLVLYSQEYLERFIKKCTINIDAKHPSEVYTGSPKDTIDFLNPLIVKGVKMKPPEEPEVGLDKTYKP